MLGSGRSTSGGLDSDSETICCLTLCALTHLFSWVPLSSYITSNLIAVLFRLASISQVLIEFLILTLSMLQAYVYIYTVFSPVLANEPYSSFHVTNVDIKYIPTYPC
jgi:hypothetical protein